MPIFITGLLPPLANLSTHTVDGTPDVRVCFGISEELSLTDGAFSKWPPRDNHYRSLPFPIAHVTSVVNSC